MSRTQKALEKNLQSLTSVKPKKTTRKRKVKETEIKWTKSKDAKNNKIHYKSSEFMNFSKPELSKLNF